MQGPLFEAKSSEQHDYRTKKLRKSRDFQQRKIVPASAMIAMYFRSETVPWCPMAMVSVWHGRGEKEVQAV